MVSICISRPEIPSYCFRLAHMAQFGDGPHHTMSTTIKKNGAVGPAQHSLNVH